MFLASRVDDWIANTPSVGNNFACATSCHTSLPWALSAPRASWQGPTGKRLLGEVVARIDAAADFRTVTPYYGNSHSAEGVRSQASEAALDAWIVGEAGVVAAKDKASAHLFRMQRSDGGFDWMSYGLAPWEDGDEVIAAAFAGRVASLSPNGFAREREKLAAFLRTKSIGARPFSLAFAAWALRDWPGAWAPGKREEIVSSVVDLAGQGGVYSWKSLGVGHDDTSDPMPTAMALLAVCTTVPRPSFDVPRALAWLRARELPSGAFPSRSPNRDKPLNHMLATDAATGYSLLALDVCANPSDDTASSGTRP